MLITLNHRSSVNFGGVILTVLEICPFTNEKEMLKFSFPFSKISFPQRNIMKLVLNANNHKTDPIRSKFGGFVLQFQSYAPNKW